MNNIKFESVKTDNTEVKLYFTSYLRENFIEKSVVVSLKSDFTVSSIYISSNNFGSVEWTNGTGLSECRKWETDEQAEAPGYLTRRYTAKISDGYAPDGFAESILIPDVLGSMENRDISDLLKSIIRVKKSRKKIIPEKFGFI